MQKWIDAELEKPKSEPGTWSEPVIALSDAGLVHKLSYYNGNEAGSGCWQRPSWFADGGSKKVTHWIHKSDYQNGTQCYYDEDGVLRNPDGSRSIFDDVDE